jgi:DNA-binding CsgD family transcriptional regulator
MHPPATSEPERTFCLSGRQVEVETLRSRLCALHAGRGGTVLVTGLAGMGKTVLLEAAEAMAREQGIKVVRGNGGAAARVTPLGPLLDALAPVPGAPAGPAALRTPSQSPGQRFWLLRELQEGLDRAALHAPVLILLDDAQWADEATLAALMTLTRQLATQRILWLVAVRSGELSAAAHTAVARLEAAGTLKITLGPLDETAVADIAGALLGGRPDPELMRLLARVQGQPLLLTELLRGLREEKLVAVSGGSARLAGTGLDAARVRSLLRTRGARAAAGGPCPVPAWPELTVSERTVVSLVAQGATNREIADRLYLSPYTVNAHLRHVFTKLGIRSRVELARMTAERGLSAGRY